MRFFNPDLRMTDVLRGLRSFLIAVLLMSGVVNILALTGSFYMLQVYDRVLTSRSIPTLLALSALAIGLYLVQGLLDVLRGQILVRLASRLDRHLSPLAHMAALELPLRGVSTTLAVQPIRDVDTLRNFLSSQAPVAIFDLPWMPLYIGFVFMLSPWLGLLAFCGMLVLIVLAWIGDLVGSKLSTQTMQAGIERNAVADASTRNAEVLAAMGLGAAFTRRFEDANAKYLAKNAKASDISGSLIGVSKVMRMMLQSAMLGLGAYLAVRGDITAGAIIAASIAGARAVAPVELAIGHWRSFIAARQSYRRLRQTLASISPPTNTLELPPPVEALKVESLSIAIPGTQRTVLNGVSFELKAGQALGVIGPSAAGKSSFARALTGVWPPSRGTVRLDGAALDRWSSDALGRHVGYLPQDVELFDGTITDNIARFQEHPESRDVLAAASAAGVHEMILRLPEGYETALGPSGTALSAGQRQRIALARALYGNPFLVVLDEPNSNLDAEGEAALGGAIQSVRTRGGIVIVISHRPSALGAVDQVAVLGAGQLTAFGPKEDVMRKALRPSAVMAS
jgi:PrtD family type I secretion system ABC transporter